MVLHSCFLGVLDKVLIDLTSNGISLRNQCGHHHGRLWKLLQLRFGQSKACKCIAEKLPVLSAVIKHERVLDPSEKVRNS